MTAEKKYQNRKEQKKGPPQTKGLKKQKTKKQPIWRGMERGSYCLGGPWNLLQSMNVLRKERRWLAGRALFSVFPTSVYILGFKFAWILTFFFFLMFNKKAVSAAMLRLFLSLSLSASVSVLVAVPWSAVWCS